MEVLVDGIQEMKYVEYRKITKHFNLEWLFLAHVRGVSSQGHTQVEEKPRASKEEKWLLCGIMLN